MGGSRHSFRLVENFTQVAGPATRASMLHNLPACTNWDRRQETIQMPEGGRRVKSLRPSVPIPLRPFLLKSAKLKFPKAARRPVSSNEFNCLACADHRRSLSLFVR